MTEVKQDFVGHPKLGLPSNYEGEGIWDYSKLLEIKSLVYRDALFVIVSVPLTDKPQTFTVYKIHNSLLYQSCIRASGITYLMIS